MRRAMGFCVVVALTMTNPANAELREAVQRLAEAWRAVGASVVVDKSRFLADDRDERHPISIVLPDLPDGECTNVVVLGPRGLGFGVRWLPEKSYVSSARTEVEEQMPIASVAGAVAIEQCGRQESPPRRLIVSTSSGRGAIETLVARSAEPLPPLQTVLPDRAGGPVARPSELDAMPLMPSAERRAEIAEGRARRDGAIVTTRATWKAGADGTGGAQATLGVGCHALRLFAPNPPALPESRRAKTDLDAEMRSAEDDRLLARDRADAPDAELTACVGEPTQANVVFAGSPPGASVLVVHFGWPLPEHLPSFWGNEPRGRMARVLMNRHVVSLPHEPILLVQGGSGVTPVPLIIEPTACYLAIATPLRDSTHAIGLRIAVGADEPFDDRGVDEDGAAVAFCAYGGVHALAEVEARGIPLLGWGLALYRLQSAVREFPP